jgi:hypothetical protein
MAHSRFSDMVSPIIVTDVISIFYSCLVITNLKSDQEKSVVRGARMMKRKPQDNGSGANFPDDVPRNVLNRPLPNYVIKYAAM